MASIRLKFRPSSVAGREGTLFYQVIQHRVVRQMCTAYKLFPSEWDYAKREILILPEDEVRATYLAVLRKKVTDGVSRIKRIIDELDRSGIDYTAEKVLEVYQLSPDGEGFLSFTRQLIVQLKSIGKTRTAAAYSTSLNSFIRFLGERGDIAFEEMDAKLMVEYENSLKAYGVSPNSTSYYMRNLRAIYNRAVEKDVTIQRNPFRHVYTGIGKTVKRAVSLTIIRRIRNMNLASDPLTDYARDIFMFSFYTRGMSFIDMAFLKKDNLKNGILSYRRRKTNQQLFIKWEKPMQAIVNKYDTTETPYLLPIIRVSGMDERRQYISSAHLVNRKLKVLGEKLGLRAPLTTYVARHGWASIAKSKNVPIATISEAMGHDSENTTRIYLASLDTSLIDKVNSIILRSL